MTYKIYKPFVPQILEAEIPSEIINEINIYIDKLVTDEERSKKQNLGKHLAGDVTQEFKLEP